MVLVTSLEWNDKDANLLVRLKIDEAMVLEPVNSFLWYNDATVRRAKSPTLLGIVDVVCDSSELSEENCVGH